MSQAVGLRVMAMAAQVGKERAAFTGSMGIVSRLLHPQPRRGPRLGFAKTSREG
jgi:hypothetical protein